MKCEICKQNEAKYNVCAECIGRVISKHRNKSQNGLKQEKQLLEN